ncbi:hypothetical protein ACET3Z_019508 [Daucus carota]
MEFCWILDFANLLHLFCLLPFLCIASYTHDMLDDQCSQSYWMEFLQLLIILVQPIGSSQFLIASSRLLFSSSLKLLFPDDYKNEGDVLHCYQMKSKSGHANKNGPLITIIKIDKALYLLPIRTPLSFLKQYKYPFRRGNHILVMCDTYTPAHEPILANKRCNAAKILSHPDLQLKFLGSVLSKNTPC